MTQLNITDETIANQLETSPSGTAYYRMLRQFQKAFVEAALMKHHGNQSAAAEEMGINRATLRAYSKYEV